MVRESLLDLLVVGLGPAGVACALEAHRQGLHVRVVGESAGGLIRAASRIDNLPGHVGVTGPDLADKLIAELTVRGVPLQNTRVIALSRIESQFRAALALGEIHRARTVCLATGTRPRPWRLGPALRDARALPVDLKGHRVVVVGGGEAALDTALTARNRGATVELLARGARLQAVPSLISEVGRSGIQVRLCAEVIRVEAREGRSLLVDRDGAERSVDHLVVCIGREPEDGLLSEFGPLAPTVVQTVPGLFAAGDLIRGRDRYIATALGDGQQAALQAAAYVQRAGGGR